MLRWGILCPRSVACVVLRKTRSQGDRCPCFPHRKPTTPRGMDMTGVASAAVMVCGTITGLFCLVRRCLKNAAIRDRSPEPSQNRHGRRNRTSVSLQGRSEPSQNQPSTANPGTRDSTDNRDFSAGRRSMQRWVLGFFSITSAYGAVAACVGGEVWTNAKDLLYVLLPGATASVAVVIGFYFSNRRTP